MKAKPKEPTSQYLTYCTACRRTLVRLSFGNGEKWWHITCITAEPITKNETAYEDVAFSEKC